MENSRFSYIKWFWKVREELSNISRRISFLGDILTFYQTSFVLITLPLIWHMQTSTSGAVWGSVRARSLIFPYPITVVLCWITGLRAPPNNRVHHDFFSRPILWTDTWYLNSFYHCHQRCMALINCKYRWFFFFCPPNYAHGALSFGPS